MTHQTGTPVTFKTGAGEVLAGTIEAAGVLSIYTVRVGDDRVFLVPAGQVQPVRLAPAPADVAAIIDRNAAEALTAGGEIAAVFAERDAARDDLARGTGPALVVTRLTAGDYIPRPVN